ncbi:MAG: ABC transporter substrate-binding protein [Spirochaetales bacterium]|jgi:branched-chain amino acid transport system substrate-binding protein|nr:MAG: ABC transporter substrate-binding protein [Spirochaetales bacterium]
MENTSTRFRILLAGSFFAVVIVLATAIPRPAVAGRPSTIEASDSTPIVIGVPQYEKFSFAAMMKNAFELAREKINKEGGIKGRPVTLVYADDQGKPEAGEKAVRDLVRKQGAVMLVGGYSSSNSVYMAGTAEKLDRPFLISTAADDRITQRKWKNVYRLNPPASGYTQGLEEFFLNTIKPKSIAIVYENSPYGTGGALRMMWFCRENGIEIRKILPYHRERTDPAYIQRILSPLKDESPDVIYMVSYLKDAIAMVREIRAMKIKSLLVGGAGGFTHPNFITKSGEGANLVLTATLWSPELKYPGIRQYCDEFTNACGMIPDYHAAEAYSALLVAADALRRADSLSPQSIRAALDKTDMITPFGPVRFSSFEKYERQNNLPTQVLQVINGRLTCVWPRDLATGTFVPPPEWRMSTSK